jgi:serine phosphatase RsbU (regulator of sigma subunit)
MRQTHLGEAVSISMEAGDILGLISDGIYEYENESGAHFGQQGIARIIAEHPNATADELVQRIMRAARHHGGTVPQADDITIVLVRRLANTQ